MTETETFSFSNVTVSGENGIYGNLMDYSPTRLSQQARQEVHVQWLI